MKELWDLIKTIVTTPAGIVALVGLILLVLAAAGGVPKVGLVIDDPNWRLALGGFGGVFLIAIAAKSLVPVRDAGIKESEVDALGIKITRPVPDAVLGKKERVTVTSEKPIPNGYELRVLRGYPGVDGFVPQVKLTKVDKKLEWDAFDFDIGGTSGNTRTVEAWLIGPDGGVLLKTWEENHKAISTANREIDRLTALAKNQGTRTWLPAIEKKTRDMHKCALIVVKRA